MQIADKTLEPMVRKLTTHAFLSSADQNAILSLPSTKRRVDASTYLVREGEPPTQCAVLLTGYAYRQKLTDDGERQILSLHIPGEALDLQGIFLDVADHSVLSLTRADLAIIPRAALRELASERPGVSHAIHISNLIEASIFREWVLNVGRRTARARVAHVLCEFAIRLEAQGLAGPDGFELPMTQEQLGDATGLTSVHVNRMLKGLQSDGLIQRERRFIRFPHLDRLCEAAGFSERYLHLDQQAA